MPIYPRGESFMVSVGSGKTRLRETAGTMAEAQATEKRLIQERKDNILKALQAAQRGDSSKTMQDAFDLAAAGSWKTSKGVRTTLLNARQMVALLGPNTPITEITTGAIKTAIQTLINGDDDHDGNSGATVNRKLAALNVMLRMALDEEWINVMPRIKRLAESDARPFYYTEEEEREMVDACHHLGLPVLANYIHFAVDTGFRRSEALKFDVANYRDGHLRLDNTKNGMGRTIPATALVADLLDKVATGRVFASLTESILRGQWTMMRDYLGKKDDPKYIVHVLRHTTATRLAIAGATGPEIMGYMGHLSIQTSVRYIHLAGAHLKGVAKLLTRTPLPPPALRLVSGGER